MMDWIVRVFRFITFRTYLDARRAIKRRANYDFLKNEITKRHLAGFNGLTVNFPGRTFDSLDMQCFRPPMYQIAKNQDQKFCIFWHSKKMSEEIGGQVVEEQQPPVQNAEGQILQDAGG